jgi:plasmid stabilization system protein ParE
MPRPRRSVGKQTIVPVKLSPAELARLERLRTALAKHWGRLATLTRSEVIRAALELLAGQQGGGNAA